MIVKNLHVLSFTSLFKDIISKESLDYDFLRLKAGQLSDLSNRSTAIIAHIVRLLHREVKIIGHNTTDIMWVCPRSELPIELPKEYASFSHTHQVFSVGLYVTSRKYILWDGEHLVSRGTILSRRDIPKACKLLFESKVKDILLGSTTDIDLSSLPLDDFLFKSSSISDRILNDEGRKVPYNKEATQSVNVDVYRSLVDKYLEPLIV